MNQHRNTSGATIPRRRVPRDSDATMLPRLLLLLAPTASALSAEPSAGLAVPQLRWVDAAPLVANSGWDYGWNHSVKRCDRPGWHGGVDPCTGPYARLPLAAKTGEWCDPPCPVRSQVWGEGQNGAVSSSHHNAYTLPLLHAPALLLVTVLVAACWRACLTSDTLGWEWHH